MRRLFNWLKFKREQDYSDSVKRTEWQFFVPGVNSGAYGNTLCVNCRIQDLKAGFFKLKPVISYAEIKLSKEEFDQLYEEMRAIKALRDELPKIIKEMP